MSDNLPCIYLARHGETAWSLTGQHTGQTDLPLTERGERNARRLGKRLCGLAFAKVFTSPLQRAVRTCELAGFGSVAEVDANLVEWNYGDYEGLRTVDIEAKRPGWQLFRDGCPGGESPAQVGQRADHTVILEPEVDIHCPEKAKAEQLLKAAMHEKLDQLPAGSLAFLKLTLPEQDDFYAEFVGHPNVVRVLALSGGYSREEANDRLRRNRGVVASFSRALLEGLSVQQSDAEFNAVLDTSIQSIFEASTVKQSGWQQGRELKAA